MNPDRLEPPLKTLAAALSLSAIFLVVGRSPCLAQPAAVAQYSIRALEEKTGGPETTTRSLDLKVTAHDLPAGRGERHLVLVVEVLGEEAATPLPLASIRIDRGAPPRVELGDPEILRSILPIFEVRRAVPDERLDELASGSERLKLTNMRFDKRIPVVYEASLANEAEDRIAYAVDLSGGPIRSDYGGYQVEITDLSRRLTFGRDDHRLLNGLWSRTTVHTSARSTTRRKETLEVRLESWQERSDGQAARIGNEFKVLRQAAQALLPGRSPASVAEKGVKALERYRSRYPEGQLREVVPALEAALEAKLVEARRSNDPDARARALLNQPAPDFTLKDIGGDTVSLSDHKGKVVLVFFWGFA